MIYFVIWTHIPFVLKFMVNVCLSLFWISNIYLLEKDELENKFFSSLILRFLEFTLFCYFAFAIMFISNTNRMWL